MATGVAGLIVREPPFLNAYARALRQLGAIAVWLLDESGGAPADRSGNGRVLTPNGSPTYRQTGPGGKLPYAMGAWSSANYLATSDAGLFGTGPQTFGCWIKYTNNSTFQFPFARDLNNGAATRVWSLGVNSDQKGRFDVWNTAGTNAVVSTLMVMPPQAGWHFLIGVYNGTGNLKFYLDGADVTASAVAGVSALATSTIDINVGRRAISGSALPANGPVCGAFIVPSALSATQVRAIYHAATDHARLVIADGDSLTVGSPLSPPWMDAVVAGLGGYSTYHNIAVGGQTMATIVSNSPNKTDPNYDATVRDLLWIWAGTNDIAAGTAPATVYSNLTTYCAARRSAGFKVVVATMLPRKLGTDNVNTETNRITYNDSIRTNWATFADALADVGNDATIGGANAPDNATYYQSSDKVHLTAAGYAIVATYADTALRSLL